MKSFTKATWLASVRPEIQSQVRSPLGDLAFNQNATLPGHSGVPGTQDRSRTRTYKAQASMVAKCPCPELVLPKMLLVDGVVWLGGPPTSFSDLWWS